MIDLHDYAKWWRKALFAILGLKTVNERCQFLPFTSITLGKIMTTMENHVSLLQITCNGRAHAAKADDMFTLTSKIPEREKYTTLGVHEPLTWT